MMGELIVVKDGPSVADPMGIVDFWIYGPDGKPIQFCATRFQKILLWFFKRSVRKQVKRGEAAIKKNHVMEMFHLTDADIDHIVQALISPPPYGFTKSEREEILRYIKSKGFDGGDLPIKPGISRTIFQYESE